MLRTLLLLSPLVSFATGALAQSAVVQECPQTPKDTLPPTPLVRAIQEIGGLNASVAAAVRLCGDSAKWLALVTTPSRDVGEERGWRFALLVDSADAPRVRYITRGMLDSYASDFRLFRSGVEYLLLAAEGDEGGSWGIGTYDVGPFVIADLGQLDVGRPANDDPWNDQSALRDATVLFTIDGWGVAFAVPIVLRPNQDDRQVLSPPRNGRVVFRPGGAWRVVK